MHLQLNKSWTKGNLFCNVPQSILRGRVRVRDASISDEVHLAPPDINVIIIAFLITKIICISNFLSILQKRLAKILHQKKNCRAFYDRKTPKGFFFLIKIIKNLSIEKAIVFLFRCLYPLHWYCFFVLKDSFVLLIKEIGYCWWGGLKY